MYALALITQDTLINPLRVSGWGKSPFVPQGIRPLVSLSLKALIRWSGYITLS